MTWKATLRIFAESFQQGRIQRRWAKQIRVSQHPGGIPVDPPAGTQPDSLQQDLNPQSPADWTAGLY